MKAIIKKKPKKVKKTKKENDQGIEKGKAILQTVNRLNKEKINGFIMYTKGSQGYTFQTYECSIIDLLRLSLLIKKEITDRGWIDN